MKKVNVFFAAALVLTGISVSSCQKNDNSPANSNDQLIAEIQDNTIADDMYADMLDEVDEITSTDGLKSLQSDTVGRTIETIINDDGTRTTTITFTNWTNPGNKSGRVKNGKIIINITGRPYDSIYKRVLTFEDFTIDSSEIKGERTIEKIGDHQFILTTTNGEIIFSDGTTYTREGSKVRTQVEGTGTPFMIWDDRWEYTGSSTGTNREGKSYTHEIIKPLVKDIMWRHFISGTVQITIGGQEALLDYGNGDFDNIATLTIDGVTHTIQLSR